MDLGNPYAWTQAGALILLSLLSEDAATFTGAGLAAAGLIPTGLAFCACAIGIWAGDLALFLFARRVGRPFLEFSWIKKSVSPEKLMQAEVWLRQSGWWVLILCRFIPGSRLPIFVGAGLLRFDVFRFAWITGLMSIFWVGGIFSLILFLGPRTLSYLRMANQALFFTSLSLGLLALFWFGWRQLRRGGLKSDSDTSWQAWEFWPGWLFYAPVVAYYFWLGCKYRGFTLPMLANPGIHTGGMIGESKSEILHALMASSPDYTAITILLQGQTPAEKMKFLCNQLNQLQLDFPIVLKPDIAQRGAGFRIINNPQAAEAYLQKIQGGVILQEYLPGPNELGIFYYRYPEAASGRIFSITEKIFPYLHGDGLHTVAELIADNARAHRLASVYRHRFSHRLDEILVSGSSLKLVEAGNHSQGCVFKDGQRFWSEQLEARIDQISCAIPGFFIGRFDVRFANPEALLLGHDFKILELNGASSEATNLYDAQHSLWHAYSILFRQWDLVFAIGAKNRQGGHRTAKLSTLWREWRHYKIQSASYPDAD